MPRLTAPPDDLQPQLVLISGGTAMTGPARALTQYTKRTLHLLSPFDSGGSSASLRQQLRIPAVGDLRSRLVALAAPDEGFQQRAQCMARRCEQAKQAHTWLTRCFELAHQATETQSQGAGSWRQMLAATQQLCAQLPAHFPWANASFGNLMMAAGLTQLGLSLNEVSAQIEIALNCQGHARSISNDDFQLAASLRNGETRIGQHRITGKQVPPIEAAVNEIYLVDSNTYQPSQSCQIAPDIGSAINDAQLIVLCPGSFYTSLGAQLLPQGVTEQLQQSGARIAYIPNLGKDPEQIGLDSRASLNRLEALLLPAQLDWILLDPHQQTEFDTDDSRILSTPLSVADGSRHDEHRLANAINDLLQHASAPTGRGTAIFARA